MKTTKFYLFLFLILFKSILGFSYTNVIIKDKFYRSLIVLPFKNFTKLPEFDYLSDSLKTFISSDLKNLEYIFISTNDILKPYITNSNIVFDYGTNFKRQLVVIENYSNFNFSKMQYEQISSNLKVDYIISGAYSRFKKDIWKFSVELYNVNARKIVLKYDFYKNHKKILQFIPDLTFNIKKFFNNNYGFNVKLISNVDFVKLIYRKKFVGYLPLIIFSPVSNPLFTFEKKGYKTLSTNINITTNNETFFIPLELEKSIKYFTLKTKPSGAKVYYNESFIGYAPIVNYPCYDNEFILAVYKTNYKEIIKNININKSIKMTLNLEMVEPPKFFISNKTMSWIMFSLGVGVLSYSVYNGMQSEYYKKMYHLTNQYEYFSLYEKYYNWAFGSALLSIPFWGGVLYFNIRYNNEKDW